MSCVLIVYTMCAISRCDLKVSAQFVAGIENKAPKEGRRYCSHLASVLI